MRLEIIAVLHNIRSLHNVGSIFRTADAAGVAKIYLSGFTPTPLDRLGKPRGQFTKVSLGAEKYVAWEHVRSPADLIKRLKKENYKIFAVEQAKNSILYYKVLPFGVAQGENKSKLALIFGNEVRGLPAEILKQADKILEIPMRGAVVRQAHHPRRTRRGKESLNVAVAAGIIFFSLRHP